MEGARLNLANNPSFSFFHGNQSPPYYFPENQIITSRGLLAISKSDPKAGKTIATAIMRAHTMLDNAVTILSERDNELYAYPVDNLLRVFTGDGRRPITATGEGVLEHLRDKAYSVNPARIVGFEQPGRGNVSAYVMNGDVGRGIYINMSGPALKNTEAQAVNFIHEWAHQYLDARDHWYINKKEIYEHQHGRSAFFVSLEMKALVHEGLSERQVKEIPQGYASKSMFVSAFNKDAGVQQQSMMNNADNIALLVYTLNHEYERFNPPPQSSFLGRFRSWISGLL
ncbi:hypothetical protein [Pseudomonas brassicacearum]|uniref:hypothetical protein n=1 Tax=Pseudomonas brassicacearum TaxID=930166 RepID=UPI0011CD607B|nr:hypothetical protein [Pseudomonas brassicacearum]